MNCTKTVFALPFLLVLVFGFSDTALGQSSQWSGTCRIEFSGKSTLHNFDGTVAAEPFAVKIVNFDTPMKARASSEVVVKAAKMDTGNKKRDVAMRKSLDVTAHPTITVSVKGLSAEMTRPKMDGSVPQPTVIPFSLKLKAKTHQMTGQVSDWSFSDNKISCTVSFPVSLSTAGIKPPSVLGLVKVNDRIDVKARLALTR